MKFDLTIQSVPRDGQVDALHALQDAFPGFTYVMTSSVPGTGTRDRTVSNSIVVEGFSPDGTTRRALVNF